MKSWLWLTLWILTIFGGALGAEIVPESFTYSFGFIAGTFSFMFLRLFGECARRK